MPIPPLERADLLCYPQGQQPFFGYVAYVRVAHQPIPLPVQKTAVNGDEYVFSTFDVISYTTIAA